MDSDARAQRSHFASCDVYAAGLMFDLRSYDLHVSGIVHERAGHQVPAFARLRCRSIDMYSRTLGHWLPLVREGE